MRVYFVLSLGLLVVMGCSSVSPFATTDQVPIGAQIANNTPGVAERSAQNLLSPFNSGSQQSLTQTGVNSYRQGPPTRNNPFLASLRSVTASIEKALTIEPRVIPAPDPTSLIGEMPKVGSDLHFHAAKVYEHQNNVAGAVSHYQKALQISPGDPEILANFGRLYDNQGDLRRAEELYKQALQADPDNCAVLNALGICYAKQGNFDTSLAHLYRASQLRPQSARYKNNMANVLCDAGRTDEAYAQLVSVHGEAGAHYNLGYMLLHQGKRDEAQSEFELALLANPYMEQAQTMLNSLRPKSTSVRPVSVEIEFPGSFSVSEPFDSKLTNRPATWPQSEESSFDHKSPDGPTSLPPL